MVLNFCWCSFWLRARFLLLLTWVSRRCRLFLVDSILSGPLIQIRLFQFSDSQCNLTQALEIHINELEALACVPDAELTRKIRGVIYDSRALDIEGALCKTLGTVTDKTLLYNAALQCDHKLKKLKVKISAQV